MTLERVQMLLEPEQRRKLAELARGRGKSIAEVTREALDIGLEQLATQDPQAQLRAALQAAHALRAGMKPGNAGLPAINVIEDIRQMREERDAEPGSRNGF